MQDGEMAPESLPPRRPRGTRSTSRRDQLFEAVMDSVALHGFERASLRDIAARAGMTHAGLLRHFDSKEALLIAALQREEEAEIAEVEALTIRGVDDRTIVRAIVDRVKVDADRQRRWLALAVAATSPAHPAHAYFRSRQGRLHAIVAEYAAKQDTANVGRLDVATRATLYLAVLDGLRLEALLNPDLDVAAAASGFIELILPPRSDTIMRGETPLPA